MKQNVFVKVFAVSSILFLGAVCVSYAKKTSSIVYTPAEKLTMVGKIMDTKNYYHRLDTLDYPDIPAVVKTRLICSAGLAISFKTNSRAIYAKWTTDSVYPSAAQTPIAYRGLDLYIRNDAGKWQFAGVGRPRNGSNESSATIVKNLDGKEVECLLYLPNYSETVSLSVGVDKGSYIKAGDNPFSKRILVYGSSIVQGAAASRPGMAYTSRLSRAMGLNFLNLGTAAVGKMQPGVVEMIIGIDADAYVLDCIPNSFPKEIRERAASLITGIREKHPEAPIIVMQSVIRESGYFNREGGEKVRQQNIAIEEEVQKLLDKGMDKLYFIPADDFLGDDHEGTVDGTHPNDLGFDRMIRVIQPALTDIFTKEGIIR